MNLSSIVYQHNSEIFSITLKEAIDYRYDKLLSREVLHTTTYIFRYCEHTTTTAFRIQFK